MVDIAMCMNNDCPFHSSCYRALAKPNEYGYQSYGNFLLDENGNCERYWPVKKKDLDKLNRENE